MRCRKNSLFTEKGVLLMEEVNVVSYSFRGDFPMKFKNFEFLSLCIFAFVLPILETPKVIFLILFLICWIVGRSKCELTRRADMVEWVLIIYVGTVLVSAIINLPPVRWWGEVGWTLFQSLLFLAVYRAGYDDQQKSRLTFWLATGTIVGIIWSFWEVATHKRVMLELHSAGVLTQSAMYVGMIFVLIVGWTLAREPGTRSWYLGVIGGFALFATLIMMGSRGALLATAIATLATLWLRRERISYRFVIPFATAAALAALFLVPKEFTRDRHVVQGFVELSQRGEGDPNDGLRMAFWRIGVAQVMQGHSPIFGLGPGNCPSIRINSLHIDPPLRFVPNKLGHMHNLFLTKLVETGWVGLSGFVLLLGAFFVRLVRDSACNSSTNWTWPGGLAALLIPVIAGSFNSPFANEHALLAMFLIALSLSERRARQQNESCDGGVCR